MGVESELSVECTEMLPPFLLWEEVLWKLGPVHIVLLPEDAVRVRLCDYVNQIPGFLSLCTSEGDRGLGIYVVGHHSEHPWFFYW